MAEEALRRLEEQLSCSICLDTYTNPKELQCHHVFCQKCLVPLVSKDQQGQLGLSCPTCRKVEPVSDRGVAGLQAAFHISNLLEIQDSFRSIENPPSLPEGAEGSDKISPRPSRDDHCFCFDHAEEGLKLYCETCDELICYQCVLVGSKHHDHEYALLKKASEKHKQEIASSLGPIEEHVETTKRALEQASVSCGAISDQQAAIRADIHVTFERIRDSLDVRETELITQLDQISEAKLKSLAAQRDQIETIHIKLCSCLHFLRERLRTDDERCLLRNRVYITRQIEELATPPKAEVLKPSAEADISFIAEREIATNLTKMCRKYGKIFLPDFLPDPTQCHLVSGNGAKATVVGKKSSDVLQAISFQGKPCEEPIQLLECELVSELLGLKESCSVWRSGQSDRYEIAYQPSIKGRHQLHIKAEGQYIVGSPFPVEVTSFVEHLGTPIMTLGWPSVEGPQGVAINHRGEAMVTVEGGHCVSVFATDGKKLRSFGRCGSRPGQFLNPWGITMDGEGNILVADTENHRIQKFSAEYCFLVEVGTKGSEDLEFCYPTDVAFNASNNRVYVMDMGNYRVQVLNSDLTYHSSFGTAGSGKGQFSGSARGIACDLAGDVYIADSSNHRVQVFTADGKFLSALGEELQWPNSVTVDAKGMLYVSEIGRKHCISIFSPSGRFVKSFGREGGRPGEFSRPRGIAVDNCGVVYVCDYSNHRVQVF